MATQQHLVIRTTKKAHATWEEHDPARLPQSVKSALRTAMELEGIPATQYDDLLWIMAQESNGRIDVRNKHSSARGLYQLLQNNYGLNPNGTNSFGNAVEECQGGLRYIAGRYHSARTARKFWENHHWY